MPGWPLDALEWAWHPYYAPKWHPHSDHCAAGSPSGSAVLGPALLNGYA